MKKGIKLFESKKVRTHWDEVEEKWDFAIVDVIAVLTESPSPVVYWRVMKKRLKEGGNETVTNCNALKLEAADGKMRLTDVADTEQLLRKENVFLNQTHTILFPIAYFLTTKSMATRSKETEYGER